MDCSTRSCSDHAFPAPRLETWSPSPQCCLILSQEGEIEWANSAAIQRLACSIDELRGKLFLELLSQGTAKGVADGPSPLGSLAQITWHCDPISNPGTRSGWVLSESSQPGISDKSAEEVRNSTGTADDRIGSQVIYRWSATTDRIVWQGDCHELFGATRESLPSEVAGWLERVHPEDRSLVETTWSHRLFDSDWGPIEYRIRHADGHEVHVRDEARRDDTFETPQDEWTGRLVDVSPQKHLEARFQRMVDDSPAGILLLDPTGEIRFANPQVHQQFGYAPPGLIGQSIEQLIPHRYRDRYAGLLQRLAKQTRGRPIGKGRLLHGLRQDGSEFPIDVAISPLHEARRKLLLCTIVDLSERLRGQQALAESEQRLHDLMDHTSAVVYIKHLNGRYLFVNRQFETLFDVERSSVVGLSDYDIFPRDLADAFRVNDVRVAQSDQVQKVEEIAPHPDGPHHYISVKFPLKDASGTTYAVAGISTDISDRVRAEEDLAQTKARLELLLDSVGEGIIGVGNDGRILFMNDAAEAQLGSDPDTMQGVPIDRFIAASKLTLESLQGHRPRCSRQTFHRLNHEQFPAEIWQRPLGSGCHRQGTVITIRDLTDRCARQAVERELKLAQTVQQALYPRQSPSVPGFDIAGRVFPAGHLAGDYLDLLPLSNGDVIFAVGDVSGHGFGPALTMVETRAYLRGLIRSGLDCDLALQRLNQELVQDMLAETFVTLFLGKLQPARRGFIYASAGHDGILLPASGPPRILDSTGMLLGVYAAAQYEQIPIQGLEPGDTFVVVTDGAYEVCDRHGRWLTRERFIAELQAGRHLSAQDLVDRVYTLACDYSGNAPQDDISILVVKFTGSSGSESCPPIPS